MQFYFDPKRESDPRALPDGEAWQEDALLCDSCTHEFPDPQGSGIRCPECNAPVRAACSRRGAWWWRACFPGCLPDSNPAGPFATEAEALANAREGFDDAED